MLDLLFRFGKVAIDADMIFELTAIFLVMLLIFKFVKSRKILLAALLVFLTGIISCEIVYRTIKSMGPQMLALGLQYLFVPGSLAIITWLVVRKVQKRERT